MNKAWEEVIVETGVGNYYGNVEFSRRDGVYYLQLENWNGMNRVEISKEFFEAAQREFDNAAVSYGATETLE